MNKNLIQRFDRLNSMPFTGYEGLADYFSKEGICFISNDLTDWKTFFAARLGMAGGTIIVPEWLIEVFCVIAKDISPKRICDPWAGTGFLIEMLRDRCQSENAIAFTRYATEQELWEILAPKVNWQLGESIPLLDSQKEPFDLFASILPMGLKAQDALKVTTPSGQTLELMDDLGNLIMIAASTHLGSSGMGLFVVPPSFFFNSRSLYRRFGEIGLGVEAALALPSGTFAPYTNISAYLVIVRRRPSAQVFVGQLSADMNTNLQVIKNFKDGIEGSSLELGRFCPQDTFTGIESIRASEKLARAETRFGSKPLTLDVLADIKCGITMGRHDSEFMFLPKENAIYIPLIGNSDVLDSPDALKLKPQNYAQVVIDPLKSDARFVARFFNSEFGKEVRENTKTGLIPKLSKQTIKELRVFVPDLQTQRKVLEVEMRIAAEQNTVAALQNDISELRRQLWSNPKEMLQVQAKIAALSSRFAAGIKEHTSETLEHWFETLPFPLASILRAWQATPTRDFKTKYEHLLHFFEATAEFVSVILLSAYNSNDTVFSPHRQKLASSMQKFKLSYDRATFGTWKLVIEYLGKQTRDLLDENSKKPEDAKNDRALCAEMFADQSLLLPDTFSKIELASIFSDTNKMRNNWSGHGGVVGQEEAELRNQQLVAEVQKLREVFAGVWSEIQMINAIHCCPRRGMFENEVSVLMGSNNEFLKETRTMPTWLDVERLYLSNKESGKALKILPLIQIGASPQSAKNACYFFSRLEDDGARFISYHFAEKPELKGQFADATEAIKCLGSI